MKFTYTPLVNLTNQASSVANINSNFAAVQTAIENTLSRNGASPNTMLVDFDMNGHHILNLPSPTLPTDPVRLQDVTTTVSTAVTGSALYYNLFDFIPTAEIAAIQTYSSVYNATANFNSAIAAVAATGGVLFIPRGKIRINSTIGQANLRNVTIMGSGGRDLSYIGNTGTVIEFIGTGNGDIFNLQDSHGVSVENLQVVYISSSFTGTCFNCNSTTTTGNGNRFHKVQFYKTGGIPYTCSRVWYLRNNVDVLFSECYASHATNGWVGLNDSDGSSDETNVIGLYKCTSIALTGAAIVNPFIGWSIIDTNFEVGYLGVVSGIQITTNKSARNLNLTNSIFADATVAGTWIDLRNIHGFSMFGGTINGINAAHGITGIKISGSFNSGINISGVLFGDIATGIDFTGTCNGVSVTGTTFLTVTNPYANIGNVDIYSIFQGNNPGATSTKPLTIQQGGTGTLLSTGTGANVLQQSPAFTGFPTFADVTTFNKGIVITDGNSNFKAKAGGDIATVVYNTNAINEAVGFTFQDNSTSKWVFEKDSLHQFVLLDFPNSVNAIAVIPGTTTVGHVAIGYTTASTTSTTGALTVAGGLGVAGNTNIGGNATITGTTTMTGAATVGSTLGVTGAITASSTLAVTGALTTSSTVVATGAVTSAGNVAAQTGTAITAGGSAGAGLMVSSTANFGIFFGSGAPTISAAKGSLYLRSDGSSTSTRMYVNTDGSTGWTAVTTAT